MSYTTWQYYHDEYLGRNIDVDSFAALALRASATLDDITRGRIPQYLASTSNDLAIQNACCAIADVLYDQEKLARGNAEKLVASESNDGVSQSYALPLDPATVAGMQASNARILQAANLYLRYTGLLYMGGIKVL